MGEVIAIPNLDRSAAELRQLAARSKDAPVVRRLLALVLDGKSRTETATRNGMQRQTLRDWVASLQRGRRGGADLAHRAWPHGEAER